MQNTSEMKSSKTNNSINIQINEKELFAFLNAMPYAIMLIKENKTVCFANNEAKKMTLNENLEGELCFDSFCKVDECDCLAESSEKISIHEKSLKRKDYSLIPVLKTVQLISLNNESYFLEILTDNSNQLNREKDLVEKAEELKAIILEKTETEKKLKEETQKFEQLFEEVPDATILHDFNGNFIKFNRKAYTRLGYTKTEFSKMNIADITISEIEKKISSEMEILAKKGIAQFQSTHLTKKGKEIPVEVHAKVIRFEGQKVILSSIRNITERKQFENQLIQSNLAAEENELELTAILNNVPSVVVLFDDNAKVIRMNKKGFLKFRTDEKHYKNLLLGNLINCVNTENGKLKCGTTENCRTCQFSRILDQTIKYKKEFNKKEIVLSIYENNSIVNKTVLLSTNIIRKNGIDTYLATIDDITERKKMEVELLREKERAQQSDRLKTAFLNNLSHEIRTPLNGILGFIDFFNIDEKYNFTDDEKREFSAIMKKSADRLINTVTDLVEISKLDSGISELQTEQFNVYDELRDIIKNTKNKLAASNVNFFCNISPNVKSCNVNTDKQSLLKILTHLTDNAIKFTQKGYIKLSVFTAKNDLVCSVEDTGIGIAPAEQELIFKPFSKLNYAETNAIDGNGLGLAISKRLANYLGGDLVFQSTTNKGSVFTLTIPGVLVSAPKISQAPHSGFNPEELLKGKTILVAEDEISNYLYIEAVLNKKGCKLIHAINGTEAVEHCLNGHQPDLVLMDLKMPGMDGFTATKKIKETGKNIPVVAHSAFVLDNEEQLALEAGCVDYLSKPVKQNDLITMILKYIK